MPKTVLIIAPQSDVHALAVKKKIEDEKLANCIIWDVGVASNERHLSYLDGNYSIRLDDSKFLNADDICGIWWRRPGIIKYPEGVTDPQAKRYILDSHNSILFSFLNDQQNKTINGLIASERADNKMTQISIARQSGLCVPSTICSNTFEAIEAFVKEFGVVVMKPLCATKGCFGEARIVDASTIAKYRKEIELAPTIYQEVVEDAQDLRVTIVGEQVFTAKIIKLGSSGRNHIDWRISAVSQCVKEDLPEDVKVNLLDLMRKLDLTYGAIDMRKTNDGRHVFLEVNEGGQYLWVELDTGLPITLALSKLLSSKFEKTVLVDV